MGLIDNLKSAVKLSRSFDVRLELEASIEKIYPLLTTAAGFNQWWTTHSTENQESGTIKFIWQVADQQTIGTVRINELLPQKIVAVEYLDWMDSVSGANGIHSDGPYQLPIKHLLILESEDKGKTILRVMTSGIQDESQFDELYVQTQIGWINSMANLKAVCEMDVDLRDQLASR